MEIIEEQKKFKENWENLIISRTIMMKNDIDRNFLSNQMLDNDKLGNVIESEEMKKIQETREIFNSQLMSMYSSIGLKQGKNKFLEIE